jgi:hypothetical protein
MDNEGLLRTSCAFIWKFESKHTRMRSNKLLFMSMEKLLFVGLALWAKPSGVCLKLILLHIGMSGLALHL